MIFNMKDLIQNFITSKSLIIGECLTVDLSLFAFFFPELSWDKTTDYRVNWKKKIFIKGVYVWILSNFSIATWNYPQYGLLGWLIVKAPGYIVREISCKTWKFTHRGHIHVHEICRKELTGVNLICTMQVLRLTLMAFLV